MNDMRVKLSSEYASRIGLSVRGICLRLKYWCIPHQKTMSEFYSEIVVFGLREAVDQVAPLGSNTTEEQSDGGKYCKQLRTKNNEDTIHVNC